MGKYAIADDKKLIGKLENELSNRREAMLSRYRQWEINEQFYMGNHWVRWDVDLDRLANLASKLNLGKHLVTVERIAQYVNIMRSQLSTGKPNINFPPATQAPEDISASKTARYTYQHINRATNTDEINNDIHFNNLMYGTAIKAIDRIARSGVRAILEEAAHPREFLPRLSSLGDFDECIRYRLAEVEDVRAWYKRPDLQPETVGDKKPFERVDRMSSKPKFSSPVILKQFYLEPCEDYPNGLWLTWANGIILDRGPSIYPDGRTPFIRYTFAKSSPPSFWGRSYVKPLIPLQVNLNKTVTLINDWLQRAVKVRVAVERMSDVVPEELAGADIFALVGYNRNSRPPVTIEMPQLSVDPWKQVDMYESQLMDMAYVHLVTKGMAERNVRSDAAQQTLLEQDELPIRTTVQNFERGEVEAAKMKLMLAKDVFTDDDLIRIIGENNRVHVAKFRAADIKDEIDITVEPGSALPRSKREQQQVLMQMFQVNMLDPTDPKVKRMMNDMMQYAAMDRLFEEDELDRTRELAELEAIKQGEKVRAMPWENHAIRKDVLKQFMESEEFLEQPAEVQEMARVHYFEHDDLETEQIKKQAERMQLMAGQRMDSAEAAAQRMLEAEV